MSEQLTPIEFHFNEEITTQNYEQLRTQQLELAKRLLIDTDWHWEPDHDEVRLGTRPAVITDLQTNETHHAAMLRGVTHIEANRSGIFELISTPKYSAQWDPTHVSAEYVPGFPRDAGASLYLDGSRLDKADEHEPVREGLFFGVTEVDEEHERSIFCDRSVRYPVELPAHTRRMYQPIFVWSVRSLEPRLSEVSVIACAPKDAWVVATMLFVMKLGYRGILTKLREHIHGLEAVER